MPQEKTRTVAPGLGMDYGYLLTDVPIGLDNHDLPTQHRSTSEPEGVASPIVQTTWNTVPRSHFLVNEHLRVPEIESTLTHWHYEPDDSNGDADSGGGVAGFVANQLGGALFSRVIGF